MLSFTLLGQVTLHKNGLPLGQFRSQKEVALLAYLAHTGQVHTRDAVADLLWDDRSTKQARSNLRTVLARLRKQVDGALSITRTTLALAPESQQRVDSVLLLQALAGFGHVDSAEMAATLHQILRTYDGEFLADFSLSDAPQFDEWATVTREHIRRQVVIAHHKLTSYALETGAVDQGVAAARQWVQVDGLNEIAHMTLIRLLLQGGNLLEAKAQYAECVRLLRAELGMDPPPELMGLIQHASAITPIVVDRSTTVRHNLPAPHDQFFGRGNAQREIHNCLDQPWCRLVTISGQGGVGKTRLATTIARDRLNHYRDGVWLVNLVDVDPDDEDLAEAIVVEIASVLNLRLDGSTTPIEQLLDYLRQKQILLVLDDFEHLLGGVQLIPDILQRCELVQILVTSREALRVRAEWSIELVGLPYPVDGTDVRHSEAVDLFVARRAQHQRGAIPAANMAAIRTICRMVEGLPLAIELAAALTREISIQRIAERLQAGFGGLATSLRDVPDRHRCLSIVFETSWNTLTSTLQRRLARLSVFQGGFTADAAKQVAEASPQHLTALSDKSLVIGPGPQGRYTLHSVIQAYAAERTSATDQAPQKHAHYYLNFLAAHIESLQRDKPQLSVAEIAPEMENVRLAWHRGLAYGEIELLADALKSLSIVYQLRGLTHEAESVMQATMCAAEAWGDPGISLAARAGLEQARFQNRLGHPLAAAQTAENALKLVSRTGDDPWVTAMGHVWWGEALWRLGQFNLAREKLNHALAIGQRMESVSIIGWCHHQFGIIDDIQGHYERAHKHLQQACVAWRTLGNARVLGASLNSLGLVTYHQGDLSAAHATLEQALIVCTETDNRHLQGMLLNNLSIISTEQGDAVGAQYYLQSGLSLATASGNLTSQGDIHLNLGRNYNLLGRPDQAIEQLERGREIAESIGSGTMMATAMFLLADSRKLQGDLARAKSLYDQAISLARQDETDNVLCWALIGMADLLSKQDESQARQYSAEAVAVARILQNPRLIEKATAIDSYLNVSTEVG